MRVELPGFDLTPFERESNRDVWYEVIEQWCEEVARGSGGSVGVGDVVLFVGCPVREAAQFLGSRPHAPLFPGWDGDPGVRRELLIAGLHEVERAAEDEADLLGAARIARAWGSRSSPAELRSLWAEASASDSAVVVFQLVAASAAYRFVDTELDPSDLPVEWGELATVVAGEGRSVRSWAWDVVGPVADELAWLCDGFLPSELHGWLGVPKAVSTCVFEHVYAARPRLPDQPPSAQVRDPEREDRIIAAIAAAAAGPAGGGRGGEVLASAHSRAIVRRALGSTVQSPQYVWSFPESPASVIEACPPADSACGSSGVLLAANGDAVDLALAGHALDPVPPFDCVPELRFWGGNLTSGWAHAVEDAGGALGAGDVAQALGCDDHTADLIRRWAWSGWIGGRPSSPEQRARVLDGLLAVRLDAPAEEVAIAAAAALTYLTDGRLVFVDQRHGEDLGDVPDGWVLAELRITPEVRRLYGHYVEPVPRLLERRRRGFVLVDVRPDDSEEGMEDGDEAA